MKRQPPQLPSEVGAGERLRLDKWLWVARFYRTRSLAAEAIEAGHVRVNGERVKPAHAVRAATRISVRKQALTWHVDVANVADRRGAATDAAALYVETPESVAAREAALRMRKAAREPSAASAPGRPTKRDRRKLEDFLNEP